MVATLRERAEQLKEKRPAYAPLLDFFVAVREAQALAMPVVQAAPARAGRPADADAGMLTAPRIGTQGFPIDLKSSVDLFAVLCHLGKRANPHFAAQVDNIEQALAGGSLTLDALLAAGAGAGFAQAPDSGLDAGILSFLVANSVRPSIEVARDQALAGFEPESWRRCFCPVCGAPPTLGVLKGERGLRHCVCSQCHCQWLVDRLGCPICDNKQQDLLQHFVADSDPACRIDLCDRCHHYIKTIDLRALDTPDPVLEDLATLHLDVLAVERGYSRAVPNPWCD